MHDVEREEAVVWGAEPWRLEALCARVDPELFFPEKGESPKGAKVVCEHCPVRAECLRWAVSNNIRWGVWGGLTTQQRQHLVRVARSRRAERLAAR